VDWETKTRVTTATAGPRSGIGIGTATQTRTGRLGIGIDIGIGITTVGIIGNQEEKIQEKEKDYRSRSMGTGPNRIGSGKRLARSDRVVVVIVFVVVVNLFRYKDDTTRRSCRCTQWCCHDHAHDGNNGRGSSDTIARSAKRSRQTGGRSHRRFSSHVHFVVALSEGIDPDQFREPERYPRARALADHHTAGG